MDKLIYEVIPPPVSWSHEKVEDWTRDLCKMLKKEKVFTVNLPELINESREDERVAPFLTKVDNFNYANYLKEQYPSITAIPNKICVRIPQEKFLDWVEGAIKSGIHKFVLVGGEHGTIRYPGPSVLKAASLIKERCPHIELGGIAIFTRRDEARRMLQKMQHGIDFFVSQIIFETANVKCVLLNLEKLCKEAGKKMPRIYLSLAPASKKSDIEFMQWLGVEFPTAIWSYFIDQEGEEIGERVFEVLELTLDDLAVFLKRNSYDIGFNVEQIMYKNMDCGERLLQLVKKKVGHCL